MKKIPIKSLKKLISNDRSSGYHRSHSSNDLARKFRSKYIDNGQWNDEAKEVQTDFAKFTRDIRKQLPFYHCISVTYNKGTDNSSLRVSFKLNKNGLGPSYGTSFDIYRLFIFGFPRELQKKGKFIKISYAGVRESHSHDVEIVKEAPNYWQQ